MGNFYDFYVRFLRYVNDYEGYYENPVESINLYIDYKDYYFSCVIIFI